MLESDIKDSRLSTDMNKPAVEDLLFFKSMLTDRKASYTKKNNQFVNKYLKPQAKYLHIAKSSAIESCKSSLKESSIS